jgi:branched-chain amino acid transport system permease protein
MSASASRPAQAPLLLRRRAGLLALAAAVLLFPVLHPDDADIDSMANAAAYAVLALGLNIVVGMAGLLDLGYAAFFAIGAYAYGMASSFQLAPPWSPGWEWAAWLGLAEQVGDVAHLTVSFWLMLPVSALLAAGFGVLFGAPTLRLRGDYLAIVTLGFGEIVPIVARNLPAWTNGAMGLNGVAAPSLFGWGFGIDATPYYYVAVALAALLIFASLRLRDSRVGRAWRAIREDEVAAGAMGVNPVAFKLLAFGIGAGFAGAAGCFWVAKLQTATPEMFGFPVSVMILVMVVLGGLGSVWGVVLGAVFLSLLQSWFLPALSTGAHALGTLVGSPFLQRLEFVRATELVFGLILVGMMLYRRDGLLPAARRPAALSPDQQAATVQRGGFEGTLRGIGAERSAGAALEVRGMTVRFGGVLALDGVDLTVPAGGVVAVIGPNGSGKSTLFNVVTGLVPAAAGSVRFGGVELLGLAPHRILGLGVARTFQNIRLFPSLSVLENVLVGEHARLRSGALSAVLRPPRTRREEADALDRAREVLAIFGNRLLPRVAQPVGALSYANRRRVEIARALASRPRLLLLDEPTAGMNPAETLELAEQIGSLHRLGLTILIIEHKLDVVTQLADRVVVLDGGTKLAEGRPDEVRRNEAVLTAYLGRGASSQPDA